MSLTGLLEEVTLPEVLQLLSSLKSERQAESHPSRSARHAGHAGGPYHLRSLHLGPGHSRQHSRGPRRGDERRPAEGTGSSTRRPAERCVSVAYSSTWGRSTNGFFRESVTWQIEQIISELTSWERGFFKFEALEIPSRGEIEVDLEDFLVPEGIHCRPSTPRRWESPGRRNRSEPSRPAHRWGCYSTRCNPRSSPASCSSEIVDIGSRTVQRGVLLTTHQGFLKTRVHFGVQEPRGLSTLALPLGGNSFIARIADRNEIYRGAPPEHRENDSILAALGDVSDRNTFLIIPMILGKAGASSVLWRRCRDREPTGAEPEPGAPTTSQPDRDGADLAVSTGRPI